MPDTLPSGWRLARLNDLGTIERGRSRHRPRNDPRLYGGRYPFVQTGDVKAAGLRLYDYSQTYSEAGLEQSRLWPAGTLCITIAANICDTAILGMPACFPDSIVGFTPDKRAADVVFVKYLLEFTKQQFSDISRGATQDNLSVEKMLSRPLRVPPLSIQRRIASMLGAYDNLIEVNRRRIAVLEEMARRLFDEWFVNFRFPGHEVVETHKPHSPKSWREIALRDIGEVITGKTPNKNTSAFFGGEIPFVKIPDMHGQAFILLTTDHLSAQGANSQVNKTIPKDAICVSCIATVGLVSIATEACQTNQQINSIVLRTPWMREFTYFSLKSMKQRLINLGSNGATMGNVNKEKFQSMTMLLPPSPLLIRYHELVAPMFEGVLNYSRQIRQLTASRDLLLPRLISGELSVAAAERELEEAA